MEDGKGIRFTGLLVDVGANSYDGQPLTGNVIFDEPDPLIEWGGVGPKPGREGARNHGDFPAGFSVALMEATSGEDGRLDRGEVVGRLGDHAHSRWIFRIGIGASIDLQPSGPGTSAGQIAGGGDGGDTRQGGDPGKQLVKKLAAGFEIVVALSFFFRKLQPGGE